MTDLTREQIEHFRNWITDSWWSDDGKQTANNLCDMALRTEAAERERDEARKAGDNFLHAEREVRVAAEARVSALEAQLRSARAAIASAPDETWGINSNGAEGPAEQSWPIKDELLHYIDEALSASRSPERAAAVEREKWLPTHRHYKGGLYQVLGQGKFSETLEPVTIYRGEDGQIWARPRAMFEETLPDGRSRFTALDSLGGPQDG